MNAPDPDVLARAIRGLTVAVWAVVVLLFLYLCLYAYAYWSANSAVTTLNERAQRSLGSPPSDLSGTTDESVPSDFYALPLENQIRTASVIAISKYERDGDRYKCVITELLKHAPGTAFHYKVGDEYRQCSYYPKEGFSRGEGQLMFFVGNPAEFRYSTSFTGDRLQSQGDMPLDSLRAEIAKSAPR